MFLFVSFVFGFIFVSFLTSLAHKDDDIGVSSERTATVYLFAQTLSLPTFTQTQHQLTSEPMMNKNDKIVEIIKIKIMTVCP